MIGYDFAATAPLGVLTAVALLVLVLEALLRKSEAASYYVSIAGLLATAVLSFNWIGWEGTAFNAMVTTGGFGCFFSGIFSISALLTIAISRDYLRKEGTPFGEF